MKIVVIEAYGLHLGYIGCYGNDWTATPNLDRLASEGIVFDWHYVDQPELEPLLPWHERSVATGRYALPAEGVMQPVGGPLPTTARCESLSHFATDALTAILANEAQLIWIEGPSLLPAWNLDDDLLTVYFDEDDEQEGLVAWKDPPLGQAKLSEAEWLELQNTYAAVVTYFDAQIGALLDSLRERQLLNELLLCVTARSGLPLGEHGMIGAAVPRLHDELVHVPLLMRLPGAAQAGLRIGALTQPVDLLPTFVAAQAAQQPMVPMHGHSLWPLLRGETEAVRPYAFAAMRVDTAKSLLLRTWEWVLHMPGTTDGTPAAAPQLFAKPEDRWEVNDLYQQQMPLAEQMEKTLLAFTDAIRQPGALAYPPLASLS